MFRALEILAIKALLLVTLFLGLLSSGSLVSVRAEGAAVRSAAGKVADKPLFRDPVHDGAADPVLCWNPNDGKWLMFYTNRSELATKM